MASRRDRQIVIEHAFSVPWNAEGSAPDQPEQRIAERIAQELDARGIGRPEALVAVGRASIELRQLQLPPAPEAELPDMVRFQAAREFNELDERWLLDFVPIDQTPDGARTVLATAVAPAVIQQIEGVCQQAGLKMRRLLLRPCETASLWAGDKSAVPGQLQLLIELLAEEADLTAVIDGKAVFLRTTRFGGDPPPVPALLAEIRLTMAAVQNQLGGRKVESIVLCGRDNVHVDLTQRIESELGMHVALFDPFAAVELGPALKDSLPAHPGRFASLLGMLLAELKQSGHAIDFLHPRRRAEAPSRRKKWIIAGVAAAVLGLAYLIYARIDYLLLAGEVDDRKVKCKVVDNQVKQYNDKKIGETVAEIHKWTVGEVTWLDQLYALNQAFPSSEEAVLSDLSLSGQQGAMVLKGRVRNEEVFAKMGANIRAHGGQINIGTRRDDQPRSYYPWYFEASVTVKKGPKP